MRSVEGIVRTLKFGLEENIGQKVPVTHPIFLWLVERAADLLTKFQTFEGATPYERLKKTYKSTSSGAKSCAGCQAKHKVVS